MSKARGAKMIFNEMFFGKWDIRPRAESTRSTGEPSARSLISNQRFKIAPGLGFRMNNLLTDNRTGAIIAENSLDKVKDLQ